jgi:hypothetical protein
MSEPENNEVIDRAVQDGWLKAILDAFPSFVFVVDATYRMIYSNRAASRILGTDPEITLRRLCGDVLQCIHAKTSLEICGQTEFCPDCAIRNAVKSALEGNASTRLKTKMQLQENDQIRETHFLVSASPFQYRGTISVLLVLEDITEVTLLGRLIPICSNCKRVRKDQEYWEELQIYLLEHTDIRFTHGICPECLQKLYPGRGPRAKSEKEGGESR